MVRGPAALLGAYGAALAYFIVAPDLPVLDDARTVVIVSGAGGLAALWLCAVGLSPAAVSFFALVFVAVGAGLIGLVLTAADAPSAELVFKAAFASSLGMLIARFVRNPEVVVAAVVFIAGLDIWSVVSGPESVLLRERPSAIEGLSFLLPAWGGGPGVELGFSDVVFLGFLMGAAVRLGFRRWATTVGLLAGLVVALAIAVRLDRPFPALTAMTVALLLVNADVVARLARAPAQ